MAGNIHISEFSGLGAGDQSTDIVLADAAALKATQSFLVPATGATASATFQPSTRYLYIVAGTACAIAIGIAPAAVAGEWFMSAGQQLWVRVPAGAGWSLSVATDIP